MDECCRRDRPVAESAARTADVRCECWAGGRWAQLHEKASALGTLAAPRLSRPGLPGTFPAKTFASGHIRVAGFRVDGRGPRDRLAVRAEKRWRRRAAAAGPAVEASPESHSGWRDVRSPRKRAAGRRGSRPTRCSRWERTDWPGGVDGHADGLRRCRFRQIGSRSRRPSPGGVDSSRQTQSSGSFCANKTGNTWPWVRTRSGPGKSDAELGAGDVRRADGSTAIGASPASYPLLPTTSSSTRVFFSESMTSGQRCDRGPSETPTSVPLRGESARRPILPCGPSERA